MTHAPSSAAVPFPPIPAGRPPGLDSARLLLRPFGTEVEDLELDFSGTPRPFLETEILRRCSHFAEGSRPADDLFWDLEIGKRVESLLILSSLEDGRPFAVEDRCRATGCGERMEVELTLEELVEAQRQSEREARVEARR